MDRGLVIEAEREDRRSQLNLRAGRKDLTPSTCATVLKTAMELRKQVADLIPVGGVKTTLILRLHDKYITILVVLGMPCEKDDIASQCDSIPRANASFEDKV